MELKVLDNADYGEEPWGVGLLIHNGIESIIQIAYYSLYPNYVNPQWN